MKIFITSFLLFFAIIVKSQDTIPANDTSLNSGILKISINCDECDMAYMKQELPYLNYVRDRKLAQVQIIITEQETGSGGEEFTLQFKGLKEFENMNDTLKFTLLPNVSSDILRNTMNQYILLGLTRYISKTPFASDWLVNYEGATSNQEIKDKWNFWVFNLSADGSINGEQYYKSKNIYGEFSARRTTAKNKLGLFFSNNYNKNNYFIDDSTEVISLFKTYSADGYYVKSLNEHWSAGISSEYNTSIFMNHKLNISGAASIEYNIFPYSESTRRIFRINYNIGPRYDIYYDTTVLNKTKMLWGYQEVGVEFKLIKEWGYISNYVSYMNFLNNFKFWGVSIYSFASFNLFKGFSLTLSGNYSIIKNQVSLRSEGATNSDILLRQYQLPTDSRYWMNIGISYTFGSIYNNIVNPRLN